jgi:hypothetical protein
MHQIQFQSNPTLGFDRICLNLIGVGIGFGFDWIWLDLDLDLTGVGFGFDCQILSNFNTFLNIRQCVILAYERVNKTEYKWHEDLAGVDGFLWKTTGIFVRYTRCDAPWFAVNCVAIKAKKT